VAVAACDTCGRNSKLLGSAFSGVTVVSVDARIGTADQGGVAEDSERLASRVEYLIIQIRIKVKY
jgi:hypothetical protein